MNKGIGHCCQQLTLKGKKESVSSPDKDGMVKENQST